VTQPKAFDALDDDRAQSVRLSTRKDLRSLEEVRIMTLLMSWIVSPWGAFR
jgi:hypothetical protein